MYYYAFEPRIKRKYFIEVDDVAGGIKRRLNVTIRVSRLIIRVDKKAWGMSGLV
jgi:hypothetical protein